MGIFKRKINNTAAGGSKSNFIFGGTQAGKLVNEETAMQLTAVYACVRVLAESVAGLPLHLYRKTPAGKTRAEEHPLYFLLHDEPNSEMSAFSFKETMMAHLLLWGNFYAQIIRNGLGEVVGLYPLMPDRMEVLRDDSGSLYYQYTQQVGEPELNKLQTYQLRQAEVFHVPGMGFDGLKGYSPIAMAKNAIGFALATEEYGSKFFSNGARPGGVLEHPGHIRDADSLRKTWTETFGGSGNSHKIAVLEEGMKYVPISVNPQDAQFLETRKYQLDEIARIFRVPPHLIGDLDHSTFSNIEQQSIEFVMYTINSWVFRIESAIHRCLLTPEEKRSFFAKFNVDGLLRGDYASRMSGYSVGRQNGWLSANDIRDLEDMDRIPEALGGDLYLVNGSMLRLDQAGMAYNTAGKEEGTNE